MAPSTHSLGYSDAQVTSHRMPIVARYSSNAVQPTAVSKKGIGNAIGQSKQTKNSSMPLESTLLRVEEDIPLIQALSKREKVPKNSAVPSGPPSKRGKSRENPFRRKPSIDYGKE